MEVAPASVVALTRACKPAKEAYMAQRTWAGPTGKHGGYNVPWSADEDAYLRETYPVLRVREIAAHLGRTENAVRLRAAAAKLPSRQRAGMHSLVPGYFRAIDTPMKAYLLGLLLADGSISPANQLKLEIHEKDQCLAELARDEIAPRARIGFYHTRTTPMARFMIQSADLAVDLARHGVVHRKSLITAWPDTVPPELENSFVCGYYDGDGSLHARRPYRWTVVSGNPDFLKDMQTCIAGHTGIGVGGPYQDTRHEHAWSIVATGRPVPELDAWVHRDVPGLARKRLTAG